MATVAKEAGLSQGIINLHFQSKERLLEETLCFVVDEYRTIWYEVLENSAESAAERLQALVRVGFDKRVCQRNKLAVWFAFWGESNSRPTYRKICTERDREYKLVLAGLCEEIIREGQYKARADFVAHGLAAMSEGLWLDLLLIPKDVNRQHARAITLAYLQDVFPGHFPQH